MGPVILCIILITVKTLQITNNNEVPAIIPAIKVSSLILPCQPGILDLLCNFSRAEIDAVWDSLIWLYPDLMSKGTTVPELVIVQMSKSRYYDKGKHSSKRSTEREFPLTEEMKDLRVGISRIYAKDQEGIMFLQNGKSTIEVKYTATDPLETIKRVKKVLIEIQNVHK